MSDKSQAIAIALAGGAGGLVSIVVDYLSHRVNTPFLDFPLTTIVGMGAAVIAIYFLTNTDRKDWMRCLAFAFVCGIGWKPVYEASGVYLKTRLAESTAVAHADKAQDAAASLTEKSTPAQVTSALTSLTSSVVQAQNALPQVSTPAAQDKVEKTTADAVGAIERIATTQPAEASSSLALVGNSAVQRGDTTSARVALRALETIQLNPRLDPTAAAGVRSRTFMLKRQLPTP
jgi:hypothetical protein